jgi:anthranilate/para-aminobenzoate synthase component II
VRVVPADTSAEDVLAMGPDGIFLSNGPGDPAALDYIHKNVRALLGKKPIFGICLGHQILGYALGGETFKLKFGHRGANQPVKDLRTGQVAITSQNHGYAVDPGSLPADVEVTHINLNDGTVAGLRHLHVAGVAKHLDVARLGGLDALGREADALGVVARLEGDGIDHPGVRSGEGVLGLRRSFMMAGAENLLMTLWPVSDQTTPEIMADFYREALKTGNAPGSFAKVQREWLVKLRKEKGLLAAVRDAGPFVMATIGKPLPPLPREPAKQESLLDKVSRKIEGLIQSSKTDIKNN